MGDFWTGFVKQAISSEKLTDAAKRAYYSSASTHRLGDLARSHKLFAQAKKFHAEALRRSSDTADVLSTRYHLDHAYDMARVKWHE